MLGDRVKRLSAFKEWLRGRLDEKIRVEKKTVPEPRYDGIYFEGVKHLDELAIGLEGREDVHAADAVFQVQVEVVLLCNAD